MFVIRRILDWYYQLIRFLLTISLAVVLVPITLQILSRFTGLIPRYIWTEEAARFCFVWIVMLGSVIAVRDSAHFDVDLLPAPETPGQEATGRILVHTFMMVFSVFFASYGYQFAEFGWNQQSEMSEINMLWIYIAFPLAGVSWALFLIEKLAEDIQGLRQPSDGELDGSR